MKQFLQNFFKIKNFSKHGEEVVTWAVFPSTWSDDKIFKFIDWVDYRYDKPGGFRTGIYNHSYYGGVGREYFETPFIQKSKTRKLVKQYHGLDV